MTNLNSSFHLPRRKRAAHPDTLIILTALMAIIVMLWVGLTPAKAVERVGFEAYPQGTVVIKSSQRRLYLALGDGSALRYPVAVGKNGKRWHGLAHITGKYIRPSWAPPEDVLRDHPDLGLIAGGAPNNPMGERALTLDRDEIAIHGTNRPNTIGTFASYGCIRMYNADIVDLYQRVNIGTAVVVLP